MLRFLGAMVIVFAVAGAIGWCFEWFEADMSVTVRKDKIRSDLTHIRQAVTDLFKQKDGCCDGQ